MSNEKIEIFLGDWLYNAGIVGFINILKSAGDSIVYNKNSFEFTNDALIGFENKFFDYLIKTYKKTLSWSKIIRNKDFIETHINDNLEFFDETKLEYLNKIIGSKAQNGSIKYFLNSASYIKAYSLIGNSQTLIDLEKELNPIKLEKNKNLLFYKAEIMRMLTIIKDIICLLESESFEKYIAGKNVIYTIIRQGWDGVSFLNPQTKEPNMYEDYKNCFLMDAVDYVTAPKDNYKYNCFTCHRKVKTLSDSLSFLNEIGFDTARKPSHVWNYDNDITICPICKLIYSCVPCGMTYVLNNGVFVNRNHSVDLLVEVNQHMKHLTLDTEENDYVSTYRAMILALTSTKNKNVKYELSDIQVVKYEDIGGSNKYRFNIFSKKALRVIEKSGEDLEHLINASYKEIDTSYRLYDEVIKKLFNNEYMYLLIHKLFVLKLQNKKDLYYSMYHIRAIIRINQRAIEGEGKMENSKEMLKVYNSSGYYLKKSYVEKNAENKLNGISYKLLNALKTGNTSMFMDTILNCYLYVNKQVPLFLVECLKDENTFKSIGYSFVAGLIDGEKYEKQNGGV